MCRQGCGRKFNPAALQKHEKACKVVFQSRRKQFNTQQQRVVSKEQAQLLKQTQKRQKKEGAQRKQERQKWKKQSEQFRQVVKQVKEVGEAPVQSQTKKCPHCGQVFNELFLNKHLEKCPPPKKQAKKK